MTTPFSFTLLTPQSSTSPGVASGSTSSPLLPCPIAPYTQSDLLAMLETILPPHYIEPLKSPGPGYELLQMMAQMGARLSLAVERFACKAYILSSEGGAKATGTIEFFRSAIHPEGISVTVKKGTRVKSSRGGRIYLTKADVIFGPTDLGPFSVQVEALVAGYDFNEPGIVVAADGSSLEGEIDTIDMLVEDPELGDITIQVRHTVATTGGVDDALATHGEDRLIFRQFGESDAEYRGRIRALPDNITPNAVDRLLQQLLQSFGLAYFFIETFDLAYQTCWDAPDDVIPGSNYDPSLFVFDDPDVDATPFRNRWMEVGEDFGAFVIVVPNFPPLTDMSAMFDDTATDINGVTNPLGSRAVSAFDAPDTLGFGYLTPAWDGPDLKRDATYKTLYDQLQSIKAAGIAAIVELQGQ